MPNRKELLWLLSATYFAFAQWTSTWWSELPLCVLISENQAADNHPDQQTCASLFEGVVRLFRFLWESANHDNIIAFGTVMIAVFTLTLWRSTKRLWEASDQQFSLARTEFLSTHRPKIRIKHVWMAGGDIWHDGPIVSRVVCVNSGTTDAIITDFGMEYRIVKEGGSLPPDHNIPQTFVQGEFRLESGISLPLPDYSGAITSDQHFGIRNGKARLYCLGFVHYLDGAGRLRTTAFCRILAILPGQNIGRFIVAIDEPDYEYED